MSFTGRTNSELRTQNSELRTQDSGRAGDSAFCVLRVDFNYRVFCRAWSGQRAERPGLLTDRALLLRPEERPGAERWQALGRARAEQHGPQADPEPEEPRAVLQAERPGRFQKE